MNAPTVSIIMGAYNCETTVAQAVNSIITQTYQNWELIICDDCSQDGTISVLNSLAQKDSRIKIIRNDANKKLAYSLNRCLQESKGKYIARMDTDDICLPDRLEKQVDFLNIHGEYAVVGGGLIPFDGEKENKPRIPKEYPTVRDLVRDVPFYHPTIMMRKKAYDALNGYTISKRTDRGQDMDLWFRFFAVGYKGYNLQEPVLKYHESMTDYKKTGMKSSIRTTQTRLIGFKLNRMPFYLYPLAFRPIISQLVPKKILYLYHHR